MSVQGGKEDIAETGFIKRISAAGDRKYWIYVPRDVDFDPQIARGVVVFLHHPGKFTEQDVDNDKVSDLWDEYCKENNIILVGPLTEQEGGWSPADTDLVLEAVRDVMSHYPVDKNRIVAHGSGNGGQMAFNLAFKARDVFRGVATRWERCWNNPLENVTRASSWRFIVAGGDRDPVIKAIAETRTQAGGKGLSGPVPHLRQPWPRNCMTTLGVCRIDPLDRRAGSALKRGDDPGEPVEDFEGGFTEQLFGHSRLRCGR